jgi:uncharacterized protein
MRPLRLALLSLALLLGCAASRSAAPTGAQKAAVASAAATEPRALLWAITRPGAPDHPLYLTGSIHVGKPDLFAFAPSIEAAFARSTALVVELDPEAMDPKTARAIVARLGVTAPPVQGLSASLAPETRALLPAGLASVGLTPAAVESMRPWLLAMTLSVMELNKAGFSPESGIDLLLLRRARGHKAIVELETMEGQLRAMAGLPAEVQDLMVRSTLREAPLTAALFARIASAWERGDADAIAEVVFEDAKDPGFAPLYDAFLLARNRRMAASLADLLHKPGTYFVAVGAGHVVGPEGIPALLARKGFTVQQMPRAAAAAAVPRAG